MRERLGYPRRRSTAVASRLFSVYTACEGTRHFGLHAPRRKSGRKTPKAPSRRPKTAPKCRRTRDEFAKEALSHRDKGSIAWRQRLYRVAIKALSRRDRGLIATDGGHAEAPRGRPEFSETAQTPVAQAFSKTGRKMPFFGPNVGLSAGKPVFLREKHQLSRQNSDKSGSKCRDK